MSLSNCEVNLILDWSADCVIIHTNVVKQVPILAIEETTLYVPIVTFSTQDSSKLLSQLKSDFKRTISWSKYLSKPELLTRNPNLNHLVEPSFQGVNTFFFLAFENEEQRTSSKRYYLPNIELSAN